MYLKSLEKETETGNYLVLFILVVSAYVIFSISVSNVFVNYFRFFFFKNVKTIFISSEPNKYCNSR